MKNIKLKTAIGVIVYFILAFTIAATFVNCSGAKRVPTCMSYNNSHKPEQPKAISKFKGKAPIFYKVPKKHK